MIFIVWWTAGDTQREGPYVGKFNRFEKIVFEIFFMMTSHVNCMLVCHAGEMRENMPLGKMLTIEMKIPINICFFSIFLLIFMWLYMHDVVGLKLLILNEMHKPPYTGHPGYQNMITTPRKQIFWPRLKVELINHLSKCLGCQQVKTEHRYPIGLL